MTERNPYYHIEKNALKLTREGINVAGTATELEKQDNQDIDRQKLEEIQESLGEIEERLGNMCEEIEEVQD